MLEYLKKNNYQNKKRPSTQRYKRLNSDESQNHHLFINDFIKKSNNNNENINIKESIPEQMKQNYINVKYNPYSEKKNNNNQNSKKYQRDLSAVANPIMSKLFNKNPTNRIRTGENYNNISADVPRNKLYENKSNPRYKKVNYVEAYKNNFNHDNNYEQNFNMKYHGNRNYNNQIGNKIGERIDVSSDQIRNNPNYNLPYNPKKNNFNQTNLNYNVNKSNIENVNNSTRYNFHKNRSNIHENNNFNNNIRSSVNNNYINKINNSNLNNNTRQNFNNNNYHYNKGNMNNNNFSNNILHNNNVNYNNNKQNINLNYNNNIIYNNKNDFTNIKNNINQYNNNKKNINYNNQYNINKNINNNNPNNQQLYNQNKNYQSNIYNNNNQNNINKNNNQNNIYNNNNQNNIYNRNNQNNTNNNNNKNSINNNNNKNNINNNKNNIYNNINQNNIYNNNNNNTNNKYYNNHINNNPNNNKIISNIHNQNQNNNNSNNSNILSPLKLFSSFSYFEDPNKSNREKMEDFHTIIPQLTSNPPISYFAIFDGHSGDQPARYCKENLHKILLKNLNLTKFNYDKSLHNSFQEIDNEISKKNFPNESGTTATVILIYQKYNNISKKNEKYITCANVGDSKCYLIKQNSLIKISKDHNCNDKNEVERIKKNGGMVFSGRVFGSLMLTRSIGDREMKNYGVWSIPSINSFKISFDEVFIIIASDGVWDVVNEESLFNVCKENLNCEELSKKIIQLSLEYDSTDNVSCVVVKL